MTASSGTKLKLMRALKEERGRRLMIAFNATELYAGEMN